MRRQFITHPQFQIGFTISFVLGIAVIFVALGAAFVTPLYLLSTDPLITGLQQANLVSAAHHLWIKIGILALTTFIPVIIFALYLSYKFVGPINRIEDWLEGVFKKEIKTGFKLRPGDELINVIDILNRVLIKKGYSKKDE